MEKKEIKKVVLAYSGGLDTSIIIPWLKENYDNCEVIAVSADVGQGSELDGLEEKAIKTGASKLYIEDLKQEFVENYIFPTLKAALFMRESIPRHSLCPPDNRKENCRNRKKRADATATAAQARATTRFVLATKLKPLLPI